MAKKKHTRKAKTPASNTKPTNPVASAWESVLMDVRPGLARLLAPLATTPAGRACVEILAAHAANPRVEDVKATPLAVEHEEQLARALPAKAIKQLVVDIEFPERKLALAIGAAAKSPLGFASLRCGSLWTADSMGASVWARDEWKLEGAGPEVIETLSGCECLAELGDRQWVVAHGKKRPWYLATGRLHRDFVGASGRVMEHDTLDPSLGLGELFLRAVVGTFLPVAGRKAMFDPRVVVTAERAYVPDADPANAPWRSELEGLLREAWTASKIENLARARPEARPRLLEAVADGNKNAVMAGAKLFEDEPEWIAAVISASRRRPLGYLTFRQLRDKAGHADVDARLNELFRDGPDLTDGASERGLIELANHLGRSDDPRVVALVLRWLHGERLKDADQAVRDALEKITLTPELSDGFRQYLARHAPEEGDIPKRLHAIWHARGV